MKSVTISDFRRMIEMANQTICQRAEEFSRLDALLGDGDHGEAMKSAFRVITKACLADAVGFKSLLNDMGFAVMMETSGSTSTLLGGFLLGMSDGVADVKEVTVEELKKMFVSGLGGIQKNTKAKEGDKTMMDAVIPAVRAIEDCGSDKVEDLFQAAAAAAEAGAERTVELRANFGRARNLGDKTIGTKDAGAASWASIFESFAKAL